MHWLYQTNFFFIYSSEAFGYWSQRPFIHSVWDAITLIPCFVLIGFLCPFRNIFSVCFEIFFISEFLRQDVFMISIYFFFLGEGEEIILLMGLSRFGRCIPRSSLCLNFWDEVLLLSHMNHSDNLPFNFFLLSSPSLLCLSRRFDCVSRWFSSDIFCIIWQMK